MIVDFARCTRGAAAAEMALILPLALVLVFAGLETGHFFYQEHQVVKGLRDGGRFAARQTFDNINCRGGSPSAIPGATQNAIRNLVRTGQLSNGQARITNWADSDITITVTCPNSAQSQTGIYDATERAAQVNISTTFSYDPLFNGLGVLTDAVSLSATHQATVMGI